jgi:cation:H+ antiporter
MLLPLMSPAALLIAFGLVVGGLSLLAIGGDVLVRGAVALARAAGLTTAVIGLTVVALGTSMPELVVSMIASIRGQPDITVGNVVGSNLFNTLIILGLMAVVRPVTIHSAAVKVDWPVTVLVTALAILVFRDGTIDRPEGIVFTAGLISFVAFSVWLARREVTRAEAQPIVERVEGPVARDGTRALLQSTALVITGLAALILGGRLLVDGAVQLARLAGITERVIGLTIVAAGTSAPEVAASLAAARKGHGEMAVANLLGSNIFNLLGILGITALVTPVPVAAEILRSDAWWLLASAVVLFPLMRTGRKVTRVDGILLLLAYGVYLAQLFLRGADGGG